MCEKALALLTKILNTVTALMFIVMAVLVFLQVLFRYVLNSPLTGSEEAARAILLYIVMIGSAVAVGNRSHMAIDYFHERFPKVLKYVASFLYVASIAVIAGLFVFQGWDLAQRTMFQTTPALQIPKGMIVYAFPLGGLLMCLYTVGLIVQGMRAAKNPASPPEQDKVR